MILWMILTILCSAAAVLVSAPFLRRYGEAGTTAAADLSVYRDQLGEVEREASAGLIDQGQAVTARAEIQRRVLAADRKATALAPGASWADNRIAVVGIAGIVVLGSVGLYTMTGRPEVPSVSAAARQTVALQIQAPPQPSGGAPVRNGGSAAAPAQPGGANGAAASLGSVDEMIERIVARLKQNPGNADDWRMLGWSYFGTERYADAAEAYGKATALQPKIAALHAAQGEALVRAAQGLVTPQAKTAFEATHALEPKEPRARFFLGMAKEQAGDKAAALNDWVALISDADPSEDWVPDLQQRIAELAQQIGVPVPAVAQAPRAAGPPPMKLLKDAEPAAPSPPPAQATAPAPEKGPTAADVKAAEAMAPGDRAAMVKGMVDSLAERLEKSPRDVDGWIKLMRSRKVLGDEVAARQALKRALEVFAEAPKERAQIVAAAMELQVVP